MRPPTTTVLLALVVLAVAGCGGAEDFKGTAAASSGGGGGGSVDLVAYSTPKVVYDELLPAFRAAPEGRGVRVSTSFGASGDQSRAVQGGLSADVVSFSIDPDLDRLVDAGLVAPDARRLISTSQVVLITRKGNPKGIRGWDDLLRDGVEVITPNPFTSGAAKWNLLAAHGAPGSGRGLPYVERLLEDHVEVQPKSGREALQAFLDGQGDVLLSYAYEAETARLQGADDIEAVVPQDTIRIEIVIAPTKDASDAALRFIAFARSAAGQRHFAKYGYDAPDATPGTFTIADLGGWERVDADLFDPEDGAIAKLAAGAGASTGD